MRLEMSAIDHDCVAVTVWLSQITEVMSENTYARPPDKAVLEGFVGAIDWRCIPPLQSVAQDIDDTAQIAPVIHLRFAT